MFKDLSLPISKQIIFTALSLFLQFSLTTIDFIFLEKISYLASIGVASLISFIYMAQSIINLFSQAMINNSIYYDPGRKAIFSKMIFIGFILTLSIAFTITGMIFFFKDYIISLIKVNSDAKDFALTYIKYIAPLFIFWAIQQYCSYILYSLSMAKINFLCYILILIFNTIFNYIAVFILDWQVIGIAVSTIVSLIMILPIYIYFIKKNIILGKAKIFSKDIRKKTIFGLKRLGIVSIIEPIAYNSIQFILLIIISHIGQEWLSAKRHASNLLLVCVTLSMSFAIILQLYISKLYGEGKLREIKKLYIKYLYYGMSAVFIFSILSLLITYVFKDFISTDANVIKYMIICMALGLFMEPMRFLSMYSKAHIKGLQQANIPFLLSFLMKLLILYPSYYLIVKYTTWGVIGILIAEGLSFFMNFMIYSYLIRTKHTKILKKL